MRAYAANSVGTVYGETVTITLDDNDGVHPATEDGARNNGDGNGDGVPDSRQAHVSSLPTAAGDRYLTIVTSGGCGQNENTQTYSEASQGGDPAYDYPFGLVGFELPCAQATVRVIYHGVPDLTNYTYRKYGPLPPAFDAPKWYTLSPVTFGTMRVGGQTTAYAEFLLTDGETGDDTGEDGRIVDQGGPGVPRASAPVAVPTMTEWGIILFIVLAGFVAVSSLRQRERLPFKRSG